MRSPEFFCKIDKIDRKALSSALQQTGAHSDHFTRYQSYVEAIPRSSGTLAFHPKALMCETSSNLRGFRPDERSKTIRPVTAHHARYHLFASSATTKILAHSDVQQVGPIEILYQKACRIRRIIDVEKFPPERHDSPLPRSQDCRERPP